MYLENLKDIWGSKRKDIKKIFTSEDSVPMHPDVPKKIFEVILKKHNLLIITFHSLRHT
ncbi:MAG: hypothetical protein PHS45_04595 [Bacilli bacterium]|nr:hypothetical protein [Bacilli bacterium]